MKPSNKGNKEKILREKAKMNSFEERKNIFVILKR